MKLSVSLLVTSLLSLVDAQGSNGTATVPNATAATGTTGNGTNDTGTTITGTTNSSTGSPLNDSAETTPPSDSVSVDTNTTNGETSIISNETMASNMTMNETLIEGCDSTLYYSSLPADSASWTMAQLEDLITTTHKVILPSLGTKGQANILTALVDLDPGYDDPDETVRLYDRNIDFEAAQQNTPEGWRRGDLWPLKRGAGLDTKAGTDVHTKRPADWEVDSELMNFFWGECGTVESEEACQRPAVANQTDVTTATDYKIKTPSEELRGAVARSVLYTHLRYATELNLKVTDCPPFAVTDYGYKSELLRWHEAYPVTDEEMARNNRACSRWQGNRNPLVDYPTLVEQFYGTPDTTLEGTYLYSQCAAAAVETLSPTATPNECSALEPGDVSILIFNSDPVDQIVLFPVVDLPASIGSLYITDRAWNGTDFCAGEEGTIEYVIPPEGRKAGKVFGYKVLFPDDPGTWQDVEGEGNGLFDLSTLQGDNMFVYCLNADNQPHFLSAILYNDAGFSADSSTTTATPPPPTNATTEVVTTQLAVAGSTCDVSTTTLPSDLAPAGTKGVLALPFAPNYLYEGVRDGNKVELLAAFNDPANYKGNNVPYNIVTSSAMSVSALWTAALVLGAVVTTL